MKNLIFINLGPTKEEIPLVNNPFFLLFSINRAKNFKNLLIKNIRTNPPDCTLAVRRLTNFFLIEKTPDEFRLPWVIM